MVRWTLPVALVLMVLLPLTVLAEPVTITGTVVDADGNAVEGARVVTRYPAADKDYELTWAEVLSAEDGTFSLTIDLALPFRQLSVVAVKHPYALGVATVVAPGDEVRLRLSPDPQEQTGTVVSAEGKPIPDALVSLRFLSMPDDGYVVFGGVDSPMAVHTEADGRFALGQLPPGAEAFVNVEAEGYARYTQAGGTSPLPPDGLHIILEPEAVISGRVTRDGTAAAGVAIAAQGHNEGGGKALSDDHGRYRLTKLRAGTYNVMLEEVGDHTAVAVAGVTVAAGEEADGVNLELIEGAVVEGRVLAAENRASIPYAGIAAYGPARPRSTAMCQATRTGRDARYSLRLPPGRNMVYYQGGASGYGEATEKRIWLDLEDGEHRTGVDFFLGVPARLAGVVVHPDGRPAASAKVWAQGGSTNYHPREPVVTDAQGQFEMSPRRGASDAPWLMYAVDEDGGLCAVRMVPAADEDLRLELKQAAWAVAEVVDTQGGPLEGIEARVWVTWDSVDGRDLPFRPKSDAEGRLRAGPLPPDMRLEVLPSSEANRMAVNSDWWDLQQYTIGPGETKQLPPLVLRPGGRTLSGRVLSADGDPVAGATVLAYGDLKGGSTAVETGADGTFTFTELKSRGDIGVLAISPDRSKAGTMPLDPDIALQADIYLDEPCTICVTVTKADGAPARGVYVTLRSRELPHFTPLLGGTLLGGTREADEQGQYTFTGIPAGLECTVSAFDQETRQTASERIVVIEGDHNISIQLEAR